MDSQHGQAPRAGEDIRSELDAIQERLRALKRELDARKSVATAADQERAQRVTAKRAAADD